jgi:Family of unknown function (DUF5681)
MSWDDDDAVGYGRPPKWTRFKKGKSGNDKGRPRVERAQAKPTPTESPQDDALREALNKEIEITEGGKRVKVKVGDLLPKLQANLAVQGSETAQRGLMAERRQLEARDQERAALAEEQRIKVYQFMVSKRDRQAQAWRETAARGMEPAEPWPHPDDFFFSRSGYHWRIRGPSDPEDVPTYEKIRADRDAMVVRAVIELKRGRKFVHLVKLYGVVCMQLDVYLPSRWQLGVDGWLQTVRVFAEQPVRFLRALLAMFEQRSQALTPLWVDPKTERSIYKETNRLMQPLLRRMGYRSLKQFEAAYAELGAQTPMPRRRANPT